MAEARAKADAKSAEVRIRFYNAKTKKPVSVKDVLFFNSDGDEEKPSKAEHPEDGVSHYHFHSEGLYQIQFPQLKTECEILTSRFGNDLLFRAKHEECCCLEVPYDSVTVSGITVHVEDTEEKPLSGVVVEVAQVDQTSEFNYPTAITARQTTACGDCEFTGLQVSRVYRVTAIAPASYAFEKPENAAQSVHLCGSTMEQLTFNLRRTFHYQRIVLVNEAGEPWEGATIDLCCETEKPGDHTATVTNGIAVFEDLPAGVYSMTARSMDNEKLALSESVMNVTGRSQIRVIHAAALDSITYRGKLLTAEGSVLPRERLQFLQPGSGHLLGEVTTDEEGNYLFTCTQPFVEVAVKGQRTQVSAEEQAAEGTPWLEMGQ